MTGFMEAVGPCAVCRQKDASPERDQMQRIERALYGVKEEAERPDGRERFSWMFSEHCRYGMSCRYLDGHERECRMIAERIEAKLRACVKDGAKYHEVLRLLQGHFPAVYRQLEVLHAKAENGEGQ